jgi:drug/metabolite transporter (DMT)-like permease
MRRSLSRHRGALALSSALLAAHWLTFVMSLQRIPIGTVLLGIYLAPFAVAALAHRILGERITSRQAAALAAAFVGSVLVLQPQKTTGWGGLGLISFSALAYAGSIIASKRALSTVAPVAVTMVQLGLVALILAPLVVLDPAPVGRRDLAVLLTLGVVYSALALLAYLVFLRDLPATVSAILLYLEPGSAFLSGWLFLDEAPAASTLVGAILILAAGALTTAEATHTATPSARPIQ